MGLVVETGGNAWLNPGDLIDKPVRCQLKRLGLPSWVAEAQLGSWGGVIINDGGPVQVEQQIGDDGFR